MLLDFLHSAYALKKSTFSNARLSGQVYVLHITALKVSNLIWSKFKILRTRVGGRGADLPFWRKRNGGKKAVKPEKEIKSTSTYRFNNCKIT